VRRSEGVLQAGMGIESDKSPGFFPAIRPMKLH
jgi:hypothetical protein